MKLLKYLLGEGVQPQVRDSVNALWGLGALPQIRGTWFYVDPTSGANTNAGTSADNAVADIQTAYALCTSGAGDGIVLLSAGTTASGTTSYLTHPLLWTKHGITVFGAAAPVRMFGRARVATKDVTTGSITTISFTNSGTSDYISDSAGGFITAGFKVGDKIIVDSTSNTNDGTYTITALTATKMTLDTGDSLTTESAATAGATVITNYCTEVINISGNNNTFYNVHMFNADTASTSVGGLVITGDRNAFINCHVVGGGGCAAAATISSLELGASADENTFVGCTFGSDTIDRGDNANTEVSITGTAYRNRFYGCEFLSMAGSGTAHGAIKSSAAGNLGTDIIFRDCDFICFRPNEAASMASVFIGTAPTSGRILILGTSALSGYAAWDAAGGNDRVYVGMPTYAASGAGGIPTTI